MKVPRNKAGEKTTRRKRLEARTPVGRPVRTLAIACWCAALQPEFVPITIEQPWQPVDAPSHNGALISVCQVVYRSNLSGR